MIASLSAALGQMFDPKFRGVLTLGILATLGLFFGLLFAAQWGVTYLPDFGWSWTREVFRLVSASLLTIVFVFLGPSIAQMFASLFLDRVALAVERRHYPERSQGDGAGVMSVIKAGLLFSLISFVLNLLAIPVTLASFGVGALVMFFVNGYLSARTFFELAALRHMSAPAASALRRRHRLRLFLGGALIAFLAMIPFVNFLVPVFGAAMMTHEFNKLSRT